MAKYKTQARKAPIADAVSEAFGELTSLGDEMREWADNLEEKFSQTSKYDTVSGTADSLENIQEPDVGEDLGKIEVEWHEQVPARKGRGLSRADRCGNACGLLDVLIDKLTEVAEENKSLSDAAEELRDDLQNAKDEAEALEFPGMYG